MHRALFSKIRAPSLQNPDTCLLFSEKGRGDLPPHTHASCAPVINWHKGYAQSPNRKTGVGSVSSYMVVLSFFKAFY